MTRKSTGYPDNNPKTAFGILKPSLSKIPASALVHLSLAMMNGAAKYGAYNWREKQVSASIYVDAGMRHKLAWFEGEELARDSLVHHLGHDMACNAILIDALETGNLVDDRPIKGRFSDILDRIAAEAAARK